MTNGGNYVKNPNQYDGVSGHSVSTYANSIPSGSSIVHGIYYIWNDDGFTGYGWKTDIIGSPLQMYFNKKLFIGTGNSWEDWAREYLAQYENLDTVFSYWSQHYTLEGWDNFYNAVGVGSGCMDVDHS